MIDYLKDWRVWVVVAIVIIFFVWILVLVERAYRKDYTLATSTDDTEETATETIVVIGTDPKAATEHTKLTNVVSEVKTKSSPLAIPECRDIVVAGYKPQCLTRVEDIDIDEKTAIEIDEVSKTYKQSAGERACLIAMEKIFNTRAQVQVRNIPALKNPKTGRYLELDIYIPEHKVACEFHGRQHYEYVPRFHRNGASDLEYQRWKDTFKVDQCDKVGIFLITVPYNVPLDKVEDFIRYFLVMREKTILDREY